VCLSLSLSHTQTHKSGFFSSLFLFSLLLMDQPERFQVFFFWGIQSVKSCRLNFHILRPCRHSNKQVCVFCNGFWVLGVGIIFCLGFLDMIMVLFAPGSAAKANLLTGWVVRILLQILLPSSSSSSGSALRFHKELLIHHKSTSGRIFLVPVQSN
jgi:hypothetical protein